MIYDEARARWVEYQISFQNWKTAGFAPREVECNRAVSPASCTQTLKYCDNAGCESRRVVTMRTSNDGYSWSADAGCPGCRASSMCAEYAGIGGGLPARPGPHAKGAIAG